MIVSLYPMGLAVAEAARQWRAHPDVRPGLRTLDMLTADQQRDFYERVVCDRQSPHRYWSIRAGWPPGKLVGMAGLTDINFPNGSAEISLLIDPERTRSGYGSTAVDLVLGEAFGGLRLLTVYGECYHSNPRGIAFWTKIADRYGAQFSTLPRRKWWDGRLWDSLYFAIPADHGEAA